MAAAYNPVYTEPLSGDNITKFMRSQQNQLAGTGAAATSSGQNTFAGGISAFGPLLAQLTGLVKGDQADVNQAIQPEANRIKDSFSAVRNMISSQPRGGGKAGALAEAPFKEQQQINDTAATARANAGGQLGNIANILAGLGISQEGLGLQGSQNAAEDNLSRRNQDMTSGSFASQFGQVAGGIGDLAGGAAALFKPPTPTK